MLAVRQILSYTRQIHLQIRHYRKNNDNEVNKKDINAHNIDANGNKSNMHAGKNYNCVKKNSRRGATNMIVKQCKTTLMS
jgi:hypothetical protein